MKFTNNIWAYLTCLVVLILSMGYALFNESLSFNATGIVGPPTGGKLWEIVINNEYPTLNTGDGLYSYNSKYYFSGSDVNNYVSFNDEVWRIVSVEADGGVKIIKDSVVDVNKIALIESNSNFWFNNTNDNTRKKIISEGKVPFDFKGRRPGDTSSTTNYCIASYNGCNAYDVGNYFDLTVTMESLMKIYLEDYYFVNMTPVARNQVQNYQLNIGVVETNKKIDVVLSSEQTNKITSYIGLLNISDYVYASLDTTCKNSFDKDVCVNSNWLFLDGYQFFILNGKKTSTNAQVWTIGTTGKIVSQDANNMFYLRPVVVLNKDVTATGSGTIDDMYILGDMS